MKKMLFLFLFTGTLFAQPLTLEQSENAVKTGAIEFGFEGGYGYDSWTVLGSSSSLTKTDLALTAFGRFASDRKTEFLFSVPYKFLSGTSNGVSDSVSGLGMVNLMVKNEYATFGDRGGMGMAVFTNIQSGDATKVLAENSFDNSLSTGTGVGIMLINTYRPSDFLAFDLNGSYEYRFQYTNLSGTVVQDAPLWSLGVDGQLILSKEFALIAEAKWTTFADYQISGKDSGTGEGNTFDTVYGARLDIGNIRLKGGADISLGDATTRPYEYRVFAAISFMFEK